MAPSVWHKELHVINFQLFAWARCLAALTDGTYAGTDTCKVTFTADTVWASLQRWGVFRTR